VTGKQQKKEDMAEEKETVINPSESSHAAAKEEEEQQQQASPVDTVVKIGRSDVKGHWTDWTRLADYIVKDVVGDADDTAPQSVQVQHLVDCASAITKVTGHRGKQPRALTGLATALLKAIKAFGSDFKSDNEKVDRFVGQLLPLAETVPASKAEAGRSKRKRSQEEASST
jgi:hypothetical protein